MIPDLSGEWRITRRIFGENARFTGTATIDDAGRYEETGFLFHPDFSAETYRDYIYQREGSALHIRFPDGRDFLNLQFQGNEARDRHVCGDDVYDARFRIKGDTWIAAYKVKGPRKNYTVVSIMSRTGSLTCAG